MKLKLYAILGVFAILSFTMGYTTCYEMNVLMDQAATKTIEESTNYVAETSETTSEKLTEPTTIITEETIPPLAKRYGFTDDDIYLLAQLICGDAKKDGDGEYDFVWSAKHAQTYYYEMTKVLCVVMNRQRDPEFPDTVRAVVLQKGQFSPMPGNLDTTPDHIAIERIREWCVAYDEWDPAAQTIPEDHLYFTAGPNLTNITRKNWR